MANRYSFDDVQIDVQSFRLLKDGKAVPVEPKALNLLIFLVENRGRLMERRELIDAVWGDAFVTDHVLNYSIGQPRKGLIDDAKKPRYIETVPTRGYRFIADVKAEGPETVTSASVPSKLDRVPQKTPEKRHGYAESSVGVPGEIIPTSVRGRPWSMSIHAADKVVRLVGRTFRRDINVVSSSGVLIPEGLDSRFSAASVIAALTLLVIVGVLAFWLKHRDGHVSGGGPIRSLAVLPLENLSGDTSQEYLADGMTDELITGLGQISALRVISRTTAMQYKNAHKPLPQIAKELKVDAVIEGTVMRSGDRIRIAAQLIEAPADKQLWARSYEGDLKDVLGLQNQVARAVSEQIRIKLTTREQTQLADTRQVNPRAYEAFLRGNFFNQISPESEEKALQYYKQATELDPKFARAYVGIARSYNILADWGEVPAGEAAAAADAAIAKAVELEPELGEAYAERGWTLLNNRRDFPGAERDFRRGLELDPGSADTHDGLSAYFAATGRFDESLQESKRALDLDPLSLPFNTVYCQNLEVARQYDAAIAQCKATLDLDPNYKYALSVLGELYERKKEFAEAHKVWERYGGCNASCMAMRDETHGAPGVTGAFDAWLKEQKKQPDAYFLAQAYAGLGRKDQAFAWLEKAYEQHSAGDMTFLPVDPGFDALRSDPRFDAFLHRVGLPPQPRPLPTQTSQPAN